MIEILLTGMSNHIVNEMFYFQESDQGSIKGRVESDSDSEDYGKDVVCSVSNITFIHL